MTEKKKQTRMKGSERKAQIMKIASKGFEKLGYRGYTTSEIAQACGITEPILYRHFTGKIDIFVSIIEDRIENDKCDMVVVQGFMSKHVDEKIKRVMTKAVRKFGKKRIGEALSGK